MRFSAVFLFLAITTSARAGAQSSSGAKVGCIDPATPLPTLARMYDQWPPVRSGTRSPEAREALELYLRTRKESDYSKALLKYANLEADYPSDMHAKVGLAILHSTGPDLNFEGGDGYRHMALMNNAMSDTRAVREIEWILERDSTQWLMAVALTRIALASPPEESRMRNAYNALARALSADPGNFTLHLAMRDLLVKDERYLEAADYLDQYPANCTAYMHAQAELTMLNGDTAAGSRMYLAALDSARPADLDRFYDDIRVMASIGQLKNFHATPPERRAKWLRAFWERTAAASGRTVEIRVAEQTVRAAYADAHFRTGHFQANVMYHADTRLAVISDTSHIIPWDAAGVYYVRHGPPDRRYKAGGDVGSIEGWVYAQRDTPIVVLISRMPTEQGGWRPMEFPPCGPSFLGRFNVERARERIRTGIGIDVRDMYFAIADFDPRYQDMLQFCTKTAAWPNPYKYYPLEQLRREFEVENYHLLPRVAHTESALPHFRGNVRLSLSAYEFRGTDGSPEVVAVSWLPVVDLRDSTSTAQRLRMSYTVTDTLTGSMRLDTVVAVPNAATGVVRLPVTWRNPSVRNGTLRVTAMDPADTLRGATKAIPFAVRTDVARVAISDVVIADVSLPGPLVRGTYRLSPLPDHRVKPNDTIRLFFELYGVAAGEEIETTIHVHRTDPKSVAQQLGLAKRDDRTVSFSGPAEVDARGVVVRDIDITGDLVPGNYSIDVTIKLANGTIAKRSAVLRVGE